MRLSVACNFDDALLEGLRGLPLYELYGKLTRDYFGGGRPSFYLPEVDEAALERYVDKTHRAGFEFNYLLNASAMANLEYTREGQRELERLLEWLDGIGVDSVTVANVFFLRAIKKRHPRLKVRISAHRFTDTPRKVRFWVDNGADCIVVSEVNIYRELKVLERRLYQERPPRHEYHLTDKGYDAARLLLAMMPFGERWFFDEERAPIRLYDRETDRPVRPAIVDAETGQPLDPRALYAGPGPAFPDIDEVRRERFAEFYERRGRR